MRGSDETQQGGAPHPHPSRAALSRRDPARSRVLPALLLSLALHAGLAAVSVHVPLAQKAEAAGVRAVLPQPAGETSRAHRVRLPPHPLDRPPPPPTPPGEPPDPREVDDAVLPPASEIERVAARLRSPDPPLRDGQVKVFERLPLRAPSPRPAAEVAAAEPVMADAAIDTAAIERLQLPAARPTAPAPGAARPGLHDGGTAPDPPSAPGTPVAGSQAARPAPDNPPPRYPSLARRRGWEGLVVLTVQVDGGGRATAVSVTRSSGHPVLDDAARTAVSAWRFEPATRAGRPVPGAAEVSVLFQLEDS